MCYYDDYAYDYAETERERAEREARQQQERLDRIMRQRACPHTNYVETGFAITWDLTSRREVVNVYCPDCENKDKIERAVWEARKDGQ